MTWWLVGVGALLALVGICLAISAALQRRNYFWAETQASDGPVVYWSGGTVVIEGCELVIRGWWRTQRWPLATSNVGYVDGVDEKLSLTVLQGDRGRGMDDCRPAEAVHELVGCARRQRQPAAV